MFSENSNDRILHRSDFHLPQNILPDEMEQQSLYIEAIFEFEELQSGSNGGEYAIPIFFQHFVVDNPGGLPYLRIRLEATWEKISIVPLGGRHVNHFWRLLNDLEIPYITLLDLDRERDGGGWGRIQYVLKQLIANGYDRNVLLNTTDSGILTDAEFEGMAGWNVSAITAMQTWIAWLEKYNVFFSAPLDIDFMMLEQMGDMYKATLDTREGPCIDIAQSGKKERITKIENDGEIHSEYETRILKDIKNTLKEEGGDGHTYSPEQQKLMVWYTYFFLNRGKPSTHIAALSQLSDEELKENRCTFFVALSRAKASVTFTFCKKRSGMKCPMQRHNAINEFFDLLQRPGIAEVKRFQNR